VLILAREICDHMLALSSSDELSTRADAEIRAGSRANLARKSVDAITEAVLGLAPPLPFPRLFPSSPSFPPLSPSPPEVGPLNTVRGLAERSKFPKRKSNFVHFNLKI